MNAAMWGVSALALCGNVLVIRRNRWGFACWMLANVGLGARNAMLGEYAQAALFAAYFGLAVWGLVRWR